MLTTPVEILQDDTELAMLLDLYREHAPQRVLEIGAGQGGTLYHWLTNATDGTLVVSVDDQHRNHAVYSGWAHDGVTLLTIHGDSHDPNVVRQAAAFEPYDFAFIDADHHNEAVRADWANYGAMVKSGGIVAFHDIIPSNDPSVQVAPLWHELRDKHQSVELIEDGGFGIGVIYTDNDHPHEPHG